MKIEIIGSGGAVCKTLFTNTLEALRETGKKGRVVIVNDFQKIIKYGVIMTPALVINGVVMLSGRLASPVEIVAILQRNFSTFV